MKSLYNWCPTGYAQGNNHAVEKHGLKWFRKRRQFQDVADSMESLGLSFAFWCPICEVVYRTCKAQPSYIAKAVSVN